MEIKNDQVYILTALKRIKHKRKLFLSVSAITFVVACLLILPVPRYYACEVVLAPEINNMSAGQNSISNITSSLGFNLGSAATGDAISPDIYPQLLKSNDFILNLVNCRIKTIDNKIDTTYYQYMRLYQKNNPLLLPISWITRLFTSREKTQNNLRINPFRLTKAETDILSKIEGNITCQIDLKTGMISIAVTDQDPLVSATMADSVRSQLQLFITRYRTSKAQRDADYYKKLTAEAKAGYERARQVYGSYADANTDIVLESYNSKKDDLENEMQLKFNAYSAMNSQLQAARAKVLEKTPAFTVIKSATVPTKPAGPKRMIFVAIMLLLSWIATTVYISRDLFFALLTPDKD